MDLAKTRSAWTYGLISDDHHLYERKAHGEGGHERTGRDQGDVATAQDRHHHWQLERRSRDSPPGSLDGAARMTPGFQSPAPRTVRE